MIRAQTRSALRNLRTLAADSPDLTALFLISLVFSLSRAWMYGRGCAFDVTLIELGFQFLDPLLLEKDLLRSVFALHAQPPLLNFAVGVLMKLFGTGWMKATALLFHGGGLLMAWLIYLIMRELGARRAVSFIITCLMTISPGVAGYEFWLFYTHPVAMLLSCQTYLLIRLLRLPTLRLAILYCGSAVLVVFLRSLFHPVWYIVVTAIPLVCLTDVMRRRFLICAGAGFVLILLLLLKNFVLVGSFSTSSWLGMSLGKVSAGHLPDDDRERLMEQGVLTPIFSEETFESVTRYERYLPPWSPTGFAALDEAEKSTGRPNMNHGLYAAASRMYGEGARRLLLRQPGHYLRNVRGSVLFYLRPTSEYQFLASNVERTRKADRILNALLFGRFGEHMYLKDTGFAWDGGPATLRDIGFLVPVWLLFVLIHGGCCLLRMIRSPRERTPENAVFVFLFCVLAWTTVFGIALEHGENNRFRGMTEPLLFAWLGVLLQRGIRRLCGRCASPDSATAATDI